MKLKFGFVAVLAILLVLPLAVCADIVPVGDPLTGNSWGQGFMENGFYGSQQNFNKIEAFIMGAGSFEGMQNFSAPGWSGNVVNPGYMEATGNPGNSLQWNFFFDGNLGPVTLDYLCWNGDNFLGATELKFNGLCWTSSKFDCDWHGYDRHCPIPLPPTAWLLGSGLLGLVGWRRLKT